MMNNILLYVLTVLIWGTTWFAIKLQVGYAPNEVSIFYRALLASVCLLVWCKMNKLSLRFKLIDHVFLCGLGLTLFSLHFIFVYGATKHVVSGVIAVVFAGISFLSILNNYIFFRIRPSFNSIVGALIGMSGLCVFFWDQVSAISQEGNFSKGLMLVGIGTLIFSLGGSISKRNHREGLKIIPSMAVGMAYGTLAIFIYSLIQSTDFVLPSSITYWASLLYLVIAGSIVAFVCYLKLIKNIGPELAGYTTVLSPIVALSVSWALEGYSWSATHLLGLVFVILGNILVIRKKPLSEIFLKDNTNSNQASTYLVKR